MPTIEVNYDMISYKMADDKTNSARHYYQIDFGFGMKAALKKDFSFHRSAIIQQAFGDTINHSQNIASNVGNANFDWVTNEN